VRAIEPTPLVRERLGIPGLSPATALARAGLRRQPSFAGLQMQGMPEVVPPREANEFSPLAMRFRLQMDLL
jgi:hypothetical protein